MRVRTVRALLWSARSRRRIFFRAWVAIICQRIISGEWRLLCTQNLAPSRSLTPQRLHHPKSEGCERYRYACRDRSCSPTVPVVTSHIRVDERSRGASNDRYACCRRLLPHSLVTSRERRYAYIVTWDFWDFVKNIIFFNMV